jgi:hypothetical protein
LTEREKKLRLRRKQAEDIIAWKKKLDDEELRVREIEKKANSVLTTKTATTTAASSTTTKTATTTSQTVSKIKQHQQQQQTMVSTSNEPPNASKKEEIPPLKSDQDESIIQKNEETTTSRSQSLAQQEQPRIKTMSNNNTKSERTGDELKTTLIKSQSQTTMKPVVEDTRAVVVSPAKDMAMVENKTQCGPITTAVSFSTPNLSTTPLVASTASPTVKELEMKVNELRSQLEMRRKIDEMEKLRKTLERAEKKEPTDKEEILHMINAYDVLIAKMKAALGNDDSSTSLIYDEMTAKSPHNNSILIQQQQQQQPTKSCEPSIVFTNATTVVTTTYTTATLVKTPDVAINRIEAVAEVLGEENNGETNLKPDEPVVSSNSNVESQDSKLGWC